MTKTIDALVEALEACTTEEGPTQEELNRARAALAQARAEQAEPVIRYCPECGGIGDVPATARDCCPDGAAARYVPKRFASLCREAFTRAYTTPPAAPVAKLEPLSVEQIRDIGAATYCAQDRDSNDPEDDFNVLFVRGVEAVHNAKLCKTQTR